jgi:hypothetical protein
MSGFRSLRVCLNNLHSINEHPLYLTCTAPQAPKWTSTVYAAKAAPSSVPVYKPTYCFFLHPRFCIWRNRKLVDQERDGNNGLFMTSVTTLWDLMTMRPIRLPNLRELYGKQHSHDLQLRVLTSLLLHLPHLDLYLHHKPPQRSYREF